MTDSALYPWYVITGGPCSGKTTLIHELASRGYATVREAARSYIETGLAAGKTLSLIRSDEVAFQHALIALKLEDAQHAPKNRIVFFDRGMHDSAAYLLHAGIAQDPVLSAALPAVSYRKAFLLDLLPFVKDNARMEDALVAKALHEALKRTYESYGIPVVRVPVMPTATRADFVLANL